MGARYYDAALSRFISADTVIASLANPQSLNRYAYVYNNPVNNTDPTGHKACDEQWGCNGEGRPRSTNGPKNHTDKNGPDNKKPQQAKSERHTKGDDWESDGDSTSANPVAGGGVDPRWQMRGATSRSYADWNSSLYSGCFKCHAAVALGKVWLSDLDLANVNTNMIYAYRNGVNVAYNAIALGIGLGRALSDGTQPVDPKRLS